MTSLADLGRMLIQVEEDGRVLQEYQQTGPDEAAWYDISMLHRFIPLNQSSVGTEYRLKPKVTYYRVYKSPEGVRVLTGSKPWPDTRDAQYPIVKDFEIEDE